MQTYRISDGHFQPNGRTPSGLQPTLLIGISKTASLGPIPRAQSLHWPGSQSQLVLLCSRATGSINVLAEKLLFTRSTGRKFN